MVVLAAHQWEGAVKNQGTTSKFHWRALLQQSRSKIFCRFSLCQVDQAPKMGFGAHPIYDKSYWCIDLDCNHRTDGHEWLVEGCRLWMLQNEKRECWVSFV